MRVRTVLLTALLVFIAALALLGGWSAWWLRDVGGASRRIISDNYDSVVAAQQMKESLERQDSAALFLLLGQTSPARTQLAEHRAQFDRSFERAAHNLTEPGEAAVIERLRTLRDRCARAVDHATNEGRVLTPAAYFGELEPGFGAVRAELDRLLTLNQDAMQHKSQAAAAIARTYALRVFGLAGLLVIGSAVVASRVSHALVDPLTALTQATDRMSFGAVDVSAPLVDSPREVRDLALSFNRMQERLRELRQSDLGRLHAAQQLSDAAIDSLYDPVIVTDVGGNVTRVNRAAVEAFGPETAAVGRPIADLGGGELSDLVREAIASGRPVAEDASAGVQRLTTTGGTRDYRLRTTPLRGGGGGGGVRGSVTLLEDVTHLREIDRVKSEFIAVASHELRTPLTSLAMALPLLLEPGAGPLTDRQRQLLELCRSHADRLQRLMRALLDVGRLEAGREEPVLADVSVADLVDGVVQALSGPAGQRSIVLRGEVAPAVPPVIADRGQVERVLTNLVDNALRASAAGAAVTVAARADGGRVVFSVEDTGRGIRPEQLPRLFEKFSRAPGSPGDGAGLGLYIARRIVEAHGGRIWARSEPGRSTVFAFSLPGGRPVADARPA
jgi:NtrC-family two-component system sensor histidine kinase KinB